MAYADEVVIMGRRLQDVEVFTSVVEQTNNMGLEIKKKTKFMISRNPLSEHECVKFGTYDFEIAKDCTYLGTILTDKNGLRPEIEKTITNAKRAYCGLLPVLKDQSIHRA